MKDKILNITNGDYFNNYFLQKYGKPSVAFCEDMMDGNAVSDIYSDDFIKFRSSELNVTIAEYREKMHVFDALNENIFQNLCLWFGKDTFCQMNLLTLLAYLEQTEFCGKVSLNYIDDETFEIIEKNIDVPLGFYKKVYEDILISGKLPRNLGVLDRNAINLYFDYKSDNGNLSRLVRENADKDKTALLILLMENSKEYGLSDIQAEKIIDRILNSRNGFDEVIV